MVLGDKVRRSNGKSICVACLTAVILVCIACKALHHDVALALNMLWNGGVDRTGKTIVLLINASRSFRLVVKRVGSLADTTHVTHAPPDHCVR
jgi:hypothetical protein